MDKEDILLDSIILMCFQSRMLNLTNIFALQIRKSNICSTTRVKSVFMILYKNGMTVTALER